MELTTETLALGLVWYVVFLFSITVHEAAHAFAALKLGDPTAYHGGQVTLNPVPHIQREPFGTVVVPVVSYLLSGWTMGWASAPYDPYWADRYPRRAAWMALAGPISNLLLVITAGLAIRVGMLAGLLHAPETVTFAQVTAATGGGAEALATLLSVLFSLNLLLFAFNLIPLPPLDGAAVLPLVLPEGAARAWSELIRQPMVALLGLLAAWKLIGQVFWPLQLLALQLLYPGLGYG